MLNFCAAELRLEPCLDLYAFAACAYTAQAVPEPLAALGAELSAQPSLTLSPLHTLIALCVYPTLSWGGPSLAAAAIALLLGAV